MVGERGFEPPTPWSRTRCSTRLSHSPTVDSACSARVIKVYAEPALPARHVPRRNRVKKPELASAELTPILLPSPGKRALHGPPERARRMRRHAWSNIHEF